MHIVPRSLSFIYALRNTIALSHFFGMMGSTWRSGRVVYRTCLENKSLARDREFESHLLRNEKFRHLLVLEFFISEEER